jgi:hypothetical protein
MIHPDLRVLHTFPESIRYCDREMRDAIFAAIALLNLTAQMVRQQLVAITDAQDRDTASKNFGIDAGTARLINTGWTT